jgi:lipid II:glycine glycyltransferase (peptidoglycan interpeptide bridge formation enzyme)
MKKTESIHYIRQAKGWSDFLKHIGWETIVINKNQFYIRKFPYLNFSLIKTAHPINKFDFKKIDQIAKQHNAVCVIIDPHPDNFDLKQFIKNSYQDSRLQPTHTATILIDLKKKKDDLFKSFSENARRNIKKSLNNSLEVEIVKITSKNLDGQFNRFIKLWKILTKMKGFSTPGEKDLYKKMIAFEKESYLFFAKNKQEEDLAVVWIIIHDKLANYAHTGINIGGYEVLANYLLVWEILQFVKKKGCTIFDFEGIYDTRYPSIGKSWINYTEFKKRFHGQLLEYPPTQIKFYSKIFKLLYSVNT